MTVRELYLFLNEKISPSLSCTWDNDGLMCCADDAAEVKKVLIALDITGRVVKEATEGGYDVVLSHHPLIFSPLRAVTPHDTVARKVIALLRADVAAMSFHTRLDALEGGVNDVLAAKLGLLRTEPFGQNGESIGRIGTLPCPMRLSEFADLVKARLGADAVQVADAGRAVSRVALLGGNGSDDVHAAREAGADTYLTGELKYHDLTDAADMGMNLIAAGHFYTEDPVCEKLRELVLEADPALMVTVISSNPARFI